MGLREFRSGVGGRFPRFADFLWNARFLLRKDRSQFGEARLLKDHLPDRGLYLELGCYQPVMYSNTWGLGRGWRGWSVDAEPRVAVQWRIFRPRATFIHRAVSPSPAIDSVTLYRFPRDVGVLSSVDSEFAKKSADSAKRSWTKLTVATEYLPSLLERFVTRWGDRPTLLAMDCEGIDTDLIRCMLTHAPDHRWPLFLLVEGRGAVIDSLLPPDRWARLGTAGPSQLFKRLDRDAHGNP